MAGECPRCGKTVAVVYTSVEEEERMVCFSCLADEFHRHKDDPAWWGEPEEGDDGTQHLPVE